MARKLKMTRNFNGKVYYNTDAGIDKSKVKETAKDRRERGIKSRVVKGRKSNAAKSYKGSVWEIWSSKK